MFAPRAQDPPAHGNGISQATETCLDFLKNLKKFYGLYFFGAVTGYRQSLQGPVAVAQPPLCSQEWAYSPWVSDFSHHCWGQKAFVLVSRCRTWSGNGWRGLAVRGARGDRECGPGMFLGRGDTPPEHTRHARPGGWRRGFPTASSLQPPKPALPFFVLSPLICKIKQGFSASPACTGPGGRGRETVGAQFRINCVSAGLEQGSRELA